MHRARIGRAAFRRHLAYRDTGRAVVGASASAVKRGVIGTHPLSEAHLHRYTAEFDCRYNARSMTDGERAAVILKGGEGRRLTYRRTDKLAA
ncbi:hypothetical protein [Sphingomonas gei]|uniref:hypothetical protein n=1 Tax=Sphingomonas gei TaxID=1395960 RepID=UPI0019D24487|nr:hypothetical protein [Sphingomonas gei]